VDTKVAGRLGGLKRAKNLTPEQRSEASRRASIIRWAKRPRTKKKVA
jgi:hypothetical protein